MQSINAVFASVDRSRDEYVASHDYRDDIGDTFNCNGQEWTDDRLLRELDQFEQVM